MSRGAAGPAARAGGFLLLAAALLGQGLLQVPLGRENRVRATRRIHAVPSTLAFRLAAGGVATAAADALWLSALPRLSVSWADPEAKARWIEAVTRIVADVNPRVVRSPPEPDPRWVRPLHPVEYGSFFLERLEARHPGIERLVLRALEAEERRPFGRRLRPNEESWVLLDLLGMNLYLHGDGEEKERALDYLARAARQPDCPTIDISFLAAIERDRGNDLAGTLVWIHRAGGTDNPAWKVHYLGEADRERLRVLRKWSRSFEERTGRWPSGMEEALGEAPADARRTLDGDPGLREWFTTGVAFHPETRDVEIPRVTEEEIAAGRAYVASLLDRYEAEFGRRPATIGELERELLRGLPPPPLHGTRWVLDERTGEVGIAPDPEDARVAR